MCYKTYVDVQGVDRLRSQYGDVVNESLEILPSESIA